MEEKCPFIPLKNAQGNPIFFDGRLHSAYCYKTILINLSEKRQKICFIYFGDQWDDFWRRRQQLAYRIATFSVVEKVVYIELPLTLTSFFKFIVNKADREATVRWKRMLKKGLSFQLDGVKIVTPICPLPLFHARCFSRLNDLILNRLTHKLASRPSTFKRASDMINVLWISHPFAESQIGHWGEKLIVYDCTERFSEFRSWFHIKKDVERKDISITERADLVFTQTVPHFEQKKKINPNTYIIPNAVNNKRFTTHRKHVDLSDIRKIERPIMVFIGNFNYRLDYDLLHSLASDSQSSIVFIGPVGKSSEVSRLKACDRVYFLGEKPYWAIPQYVNYADVCLIPYLQLEELGSPTKLFHYLASGKPIVSTAIPGIEEFSDVVFIGRDHNDFCEKVAQAFKEDNSILSQDRRDLAHNNSWEHRLQEIWALIDSRLASLV